MKNKSILVFGINGQVGSALLNSLKGLGTINAYDFPEVDFNKDETLDSVIKTVNPDLIINAAAYTAVDKAEEESEKARQINGYFVGYLAKTAHKHKISLIHYSTDYVFDGKKGSDYFESDQTNPINEYGFSKLIGEQEIQEIGGANIILRTSWVYSLSGNSFVTKVLKWARNNPELRIVDDQISNPTWATMLAEMTAKIVGMGEENWYEFFTKKQGLYHLSGKGAVSRFDWAKEILALDSNKKEHIVTDIKPTKSKAFPTPANRPQYSSLNCSKFETSFNLVVPSWQESLSQAMVQQS